MNNKIYLHYDMDAFFASIEQRDNPNLRGKAIAVGSGVVTTASYEARKFGIKSAIFLITDNTDLIVHVLAPYEPKQSLN